jgi:hypothetical protein
VHATADKQQDAQSWLARCKGSVQQAHPTHHVRKGNLVAGAVYCLLLCKHATITPLSMNTAQL